MAAPPITATPSSTGITVQWSGSIGYQIELRVGTTTGPTIQTASGTGTSASFTGLVALTNYTVVLKQTSDNSISTTSARTTFDSPSAPTNLEVNPFCALTLRAAWSSPTDPGSFGVARYRVTSIVNGLESSYTTVAQTFDLSGFASPTALVEVRVAAIDAADNVSPNYASVLKAPNGTTACSSNSSSDPGGSTDPGSGSTSPGGGGAAPPVDGAALPGVPKSLAGTDRVETAIAIAEADFAPASGGLVAQSATLKAQSAVIASSASFPDALAAGPLAFSKVAPLLLTSQKSLDPRVGASLSKLVPAGATVYVIGGEAALAPAVAASITALGFKVERISGVDRYDTAVKVAKVLGSPKKVFAATGTNFPDALAASVVAARESGAIILTRGQEMPLAVAGYLLENPTAVVTAVGGPAASAFPQSVSLKGADRFSTAVEVAKAYPPSSVTAGVANGLDFPDGLVAAPYLARRGAVLLLSEQLIVPTPTADYIRATSKIDVVQVFGGLSAVSDVARRTISALL